MTDDKLRELMALSKPGLVVHVLCTELLLARVDAERMNWLDQPNRQWTFWLGRTFGHRNYSHWPVQPGESIRAAIDAAIEVGKK